MVIIGVQNSNERFAKAAQGVSDFPLAASFLFKKITKRDRQKGLDTQ